MKNIYRNISPERRGGTIALSIVAAILFIVFSPWQYGHAQQVLIGMKGGVNFTEAVPIQSHSIFSNLGGPALEGYEREYESLFSSRPGTQFGLIVHAELNHFLGFTFEPTYSTYRFGYQNAYRWESPELAEQYLEISYDHQQTLQYIELPLYVRYNMIGGPFSPYIQGGGFFNIMNNAHKTVYQDRMDVASGGIAEQTGDENKVGMEHLLNPYLYGLAASVGVSVSTVYARISLDASYRHSLNRITNKDLRYNDLRTASLSFDVMDDIDLRNIQFSLVCTFPLNFTYAGKNGKKGTKYVVPFDLRRLKDQKRIRGKN